MVPCDRYEDLRPSVLANAEPYEPPVPGIVPPPPVPLKTSPTTTIYTFYPPTQWCIQGGAQGAPAPSLCN